MATDIGTRIKRARERKRWTQRQLASALQVNVKTIDNWENGRTSPKNSIGALEDVLGVDLSEEPEPEDILPGNLRQSIQDEYRDRPDIAAAVIEAVEATLSGRPLPPTRRSASGR